MFTRILLATDGSEHGDPAIDFTIAMARKSSAMVRVVYVNQYVVGGRGYTVRTEREAMEIVDRAVSGLRAAGIDADGVHLLANCFTLPRMIADSARSWKADVIVFGSRRRRVLRRFGGQGIRERVTAEISLPTLTAPPLLKVARRPRKADAELDRILDSEITRTSR